MRVVDLDIKVQGIEIKILVDVPTPVVVPSVSPTWPINIGPVSLKK